MCVRVPRGALPLGSSRGMQFPGEPPPLPGRVLSCHPSRCMQFTIEQSELGNFRMITCKILFIYSLSHSIHCSSGSGLPYFPKGSGNVLHVLLFSP